MLVALSAPLASASPSTAIELPKVGVFGDSVGFSLLFALASATATPEFVRTGSDVELGCGIAVSPMPPPDQPHACDDPAGRYGCGRRRRAGDHGASTTTPPTHSSRSSMRRSHSRRRNRTFGAVSD
jgi:hypothetical protein